MTPAELPDEGLWRAELPQVLAALRRRYGHRPEVEDAAQQALLAAAGQWPAEGIPERPRAWLITVASRRLVDQLRADEARRSREELVARQEHALHGGMSSAPDEAPGTPAVVADDTVGLMLRCAHPALTPGSRVALTLRAVGGLSTAQIAAGFLVPEATMAQRISRARATLRASGATFGMPTEEEVPERLAAVRHVVSLVFTEGHQGSVGDAVVGQAFVEEAVRCARVLHRAVPEDPEGAGLLALLLLTHARTPARVDAHGDLVPLAEQDRSRWDRRLVGEGVRLLERALPRGEVGPFQLRAAIAAVHAEAPSAASTDWAQIHLLYRMLDHRAPSAAVTLGLATAVAEVHGPRAGLAALEGVQDRRWHRPHAVRGHLLARDGRSAEAREAFATAARLTRSIPEQRYLGRLAAELDGADDGGT